MQACCNKHVKRVSNSHGKSIFHISSKKFLGQYLPSQFPKTLFLIGYFFK
ncbi:hypothetical protein Hanom_Chr01g00064141 [Helianthus anomalus]